jgi:hypothetical protein
MGLIITPIMIIGNFVGLPYGPKGVAFVYSTIMTLWLVPLVLWALRDTTISPRDILTVAGRPLVSSIAAAALAFATRLFYGQSLLPFPRLALESTVLFVTFWGILLFVTGQKSFYLDLLLTLRERPSLETNNLASI